MKHSALIERSVLQRALCAIVAICAIVGSMGLSYAHEYKEASVDESLAGQKNTVLSGGDESQVKDFLRKYYLARWTVRGNARELVKYRQEIETDGANLTGAAQQTFLKCAVDVLKSYAGSKDCYPACRYNAVLTIGSLNEAAGDRSGAGATPYAGAITVLATFLNQTKETPDYVRLGALIGLTRHAELGIKDEKMRNNVKSLFAKTLNPKFAEERGIRPDVYVWFQEKALQGLASFKSPEGTKGGSGTLDLFKGLIDDSDQPFDLRCLAVRAIGDMDLTVAKNYDYAALAKSFVLLARDFCVDEMAYIDSEIVRDAVKTSANQIGGGGPSGMGGMGGMDSAGGMGGMGGMGGLGGGVGGGMGGTIQNPKTMEALVARIEYGFDCIQRAVKGVKNGGGPGVQAQLDDSNADQAQAKELLVQLLKEIDDIKEFIKNGPQNAGGMMGGGMMDTMGAGLSGSSVSVDANSLKDRLLEAKIKLNEMLGLDSY